MTMSISLREATLQVPLAEADAHPDFRDRIADLNLRRREANVRADQAIRENVAAVEAAKRGLRSPDEARRVLRRNEGATHAVYDVAVELNNLRAESAAELARSRW